MLPLLSFHALAARRGDGLRPELLAALERCANGGNGLAAGLEPAEAVPVHPAEGPAHEPAARQAQGA